MTAAGPGVDRRVERVAALRERLAEAALDALLVTSLPNIRYLTGFSGSNGMLVVTPAALHFITDFRYQTQVAEELRADVAVGIEPQSLWNGLWKALASLGVTVVGFESAHLLHRDAQRFAEQGTRWHFRPTVDLVERLRERKDADEVLAIADAAAVATRALERSLGHIHEGMRELEVAGVLEKALRDEGSEGFPFPTIVASGARAALPHARSSRKRIVRGELLLLDYGAEVRGYCADITRTLAVGAASAEQRELHDIVREANARASREVRAGMLGKDADAIARGYIERHGWGDAFGHSLGHGVGLEVHEAPRLARTTDTPLAAGAVVTIEPGIYREGWGGIRIEDDVHLDAAGPRVLTDFPRELLEV